MAEGLMWQLPNKRIRYEEGRGYTDNHVGIGTAIIRAKTRFAELFDAVSHTVHISPDLDGWVLRVIKANFEHVIVNETTCSNWRVILLQDGDDEDEKGDHNGNEQN